MHGVHESIKIITQREVKIMSLTFKPSDLFTFNNTEKSPKPIWLKVSCNQIDLLYEAVFYKGLKMKSTGRLSKGMASVGN